MSKITRTKIQTMNCKTLQIISDDINSKDANRVLTGWTIGQYNINFRIVTNMAAINHTKLNLND
jgi:hypothetical protein